MNVEYTFLDKLRQFFGLGPTAATAEALHAEVVAKRVASAAAKAQVEADKAKAEKLAAVKKAPAEKKAPVAKKPAVKKPVAFKKGAVDGDGDGLVQDGTAHERPAKKKPDPKDKKTK
jgi:colicin import membrane protein